MVIAIIINIFSPDEIQRWTDEIIYKSIGEYNETIWYV